MNETIETIEGVIVLIILVCVVSCLAKSKKEGVKEDITLQEEADFEVDFTSDQQGVVIKGMADKEKELSATKIIIPKTIEGFPVKEIAPEAFCSDYFETVKLPPTIEKIGYLAFGNCDELQKIDLPSGLKTIQAEAFSHCNRLKEIEIPDTVQDLGEEKIKYSIGSSYDYRTGSVFETCANLSKVKLPKGLKKIPIRTFEGCEALTEINIPDSVEVIGEEAFYGCRHLKKAHIPSSIKEIKELSFYNCQALRDLTISDNVTSISFPFAKDIYARDEPNCAFSGCSSLSLKMKAKLKELGYKDEF